MMSDIHISYSSSYRSYAKRIYDYLTGAGYDVWMDTESIKPGTNWVDAWHQSLRDAQILLLCLATPTITVDPRLVPGNPIVSLPNTGEISLNIRKEWTYFLVQGKPILPVIIANPADDAILSMPEDLRQVQYLSIDQNLSDTDLEHLGNALNNLLKPASNDPAQVTLQIVDSGILTPEMLSTKIMPFILALAELQHLYDQIEGKSVQPIHIKKITQNSDVSISLGIDTLINNILEAIYPWRRREAQAKAKLVVLEAKEKEELQLGKLTAEGIAKDNESKELDNQFKQLQLERAKWQDYLQRLEAQNPSKGPIPLRIVGDSASTINVSEQQVYAVTLELLQLMKPELTPGEIARYLIAMKTQVENVLKSQVQFEVKPLPAMPGMPELLVTGTSQEQNDIGQPPVLPGSVTI